MLGACPEGWQLWGWAGNGGHLGPASGREGQHQPSESLWSGKQHHQWEENTALQPFYLLFQSAVWLAGAIEAADQAGGTKTRFLCWGWCGPVGPG